MFHARHRHRPLLGIPAFPVSKVIFAALLSHLIEAAMGKLNMGAAFYGADERVEHAGDVPVDLGGGGQQFELHQHALNGARGGGVWQFY